MAKIEIKIKRLPGCPEWIEPPTRQSGQAAGYDVRAANPEPLAIGPGERALVPTGFAMAIPPGFEVQVRPRSGLAIKHGIIIPNSPGTIDPDYRGELKVILMNLGHQPFTVKAGDRIAQLVVNKVADAEFILADELEDTGRGGGGFGSTGRK